MDLKDLSALELSTAIKKGEAGVEEAVKVSLEQIKKSEDTVHAFLETDEEKVYQRVKEVEAGIASGKYSGPLAGVPIAVKDNICTKGRKTTCASKILGYLKWMSVNWTILNSPFLLNCKGDTCAGQNKEDKSARQKVKEIFFI